MRALLTVALDRDADVVVPSAVLAELYRGTPPTQPSTLSWPEGGMRTITSGRRIVRVAGALRHRDRLDSCHWSTASSLPPRYDWEAASSRRETELICSSSPAITLTWSSSRYPADRPHGFSSSSAAAAPQCFALNPLVADPVPVRSPERAIPSDVSPNQRALAVIIRAAWANFAAGGVPASAAVPWPSFNSGSEGLLVVDPQPQVEQTFAETHHCVFWAAGTGPS